MSCDVGEATEGLENELWRRWSNGRVGEWAVTERLGHGCARVARCVTAWWRNFSHYCHPLRQYDVWFTCSVHREALPGAPTAHGVCTQTRVYSARGKYIVRHWTSREASLRHSSGWGTLSVSPQYRDLRTRGLNQSTDLVQIRYLGFSCKYLEPLF